MLMQFDGLLITEDFTDEERQFATRLIEVIRSRVLKYQEYAQMLPQVVI